jgi:hypothetical protein
MKVGSWLRVDQRDMTATMEPSHAVVARQTRTTARRTADHAVVTARAGLREDPLNELPSCCGRTRRSSTPDSGGGRVWDVRSRRSPIGPKDGGVQLGVGDPVSAVGDDRSLEARRQPHVVAGRTDG